jgi:hypothetical protein
MMYALLIILVGEISFLPNVSWHMSRAACERQATIELEQLSMINKAVEHVTCKPYVVRPLPPVTGETLLR